MARKPIRYVNKPVSGDAIFGVPSAGVVGVPGVLLLGAPALSAPTDGVYTYDYTPTLSWAAVANAAYYEIQIATDSGFTTIVVSDVSASASYTPSSDLTYSTIFYWRVRAITGGFASDWSSTRTFRLYLLDVEFSTNDAAPLNNPYVGEYGSLTTADVESAMSVASGLLQINSQAASPVYGEEIGVGPSASRLAGRVLQTLINIVTNDGNACWIGWSETASPTSAFENKFRIDTAGFAYRYAGNAIVTLPGALLLGYNFLFSLVQRSSGVFLFVKGGAFADWTLLWAELGGSTATLYPVFSNYQQALTMDFFKTADLPAPLNSDYGIASFNKTSFEQSLGSEKLADPGIEAWTSPTNATNYTEALNGTSTVNQETSDVHGGSNAARYDIDSSNNSAALFQVLSNSSGDIFELSGWIKSNPTAKTARMDFSDGGGLTHTLTTSYQNFRDIKRALSANISYSPIRISAISSSIYFDDLSVKKITLNTAQVMNPDSMLQVEFTLPASPQPGQSIHLLYRINAPGEELLNCFDAYVKRNDANSAWDFFIDSYAAGVKTNLTSVTGVGTPDALRAICAGDKHDFYTGASNVYTKRGSQQTSALYQQATGANVISDSAFTVSRFLSYPLRSTSVSSALDAVRQPTAITWVLRAEFLTNAAAPLASSIAQDIGLLKKSADSSNLVSIINSRLDLAGAAASNFVDPAYYMTDDSGNAIARVGGRAMVIQIEAKAFTTRSFMVGWSISTTASASNTVLGVYFPASGTLAAALGATQPSDGYVWTIGLYNFAFVLLPTGGYIFGKGGALGSTWILLWSERFNSSAASLYPMIQGISNMDAELDFVRVVDLGAPFSVDGGIDSFNITSFTQTVGSDLLSGDGSFTTWAGSPSIPNGWSVMQTQPDPELVQRAPNQGHGGSGSGAANFYSSSTDVRPLITKSSVLPSGGVYLTEVNITNLVSGTVQLQMDVQTQDTYNAVGVKRNLSAVAGAANVVLYGRTPPVDVTIDDLTVKKYTLNTAQVMTADAEVNFEFTLPASPIAGQEVGICYRINAVGQELYNCWYAYAKRNNANSAWDFRLDSIASGVRTNRIAQNNVGSVVQIKVICFGNLHDCYTRIGTSWTKQGAQVNNSSFATATGANTLYDAAATPSRFWAVPRTSTLYTSIFEPLVNA